MSNRWKWTNWWRRAGKCDDLGRCLVKPWKNKMLNFVFSSYQHEYQPKGTKKGIRRRALWMFGIFRSLPVRSRFTLFRKSGKIERFIERHVRVLIWFRELGLMSRLVRQPKATAESISWQVSLVVYRASQSCILLLLSCGLVAWKRPTRTKLDKYLTWWVWREGLLYWK